MSESERAWNDAARFLAGLPSVAGSPYAKLEKTEAWENYSAEMAGVWQRADKRLIAPVRDFQERELGGAGARSEFVFYPFSGPDVVYVQAFYPNASLYVLAGLERPGSILKPEEYKQEALEGQLEGIRRGSASLLARSFFVTSEMSRQFRGQLADGVLPVLLMLLARTGNSIDNVRNVTIDPAGRLADLPAPQPKMGAQPDGFEVIFHREGERKARKMYYFRVDLGPKLDQNASFLTFLEPFGRPETLIKSASFLLHLKTFSRLRDYITSHSSRIIQDDTGIRFGLLRAQGWNVRLYGAYSRPDRPFQSLFQKDLHAAFEDRERVKPLGFSMGYGTGRRSSHLVIADRP